MQTTPQAAGELADKLIATEVAIQDRMWGDTNERADSTNNQLFHAGVAQTALVAELFEGQSQEAAVATAKQLYPADWDGFRSYGGSIPNLVVAVAFFRSEIKRRILLGEDVTRTKRGEAYPSRNQPYVSSDQAAAEIAGQGGYDGGPIHQH